ncbi:pyridoxal-dependent decarboxylase domain protein [Diplodia corticola]|uniref:Pyridoxal-dependent decarboxylase domain protein n=1 Tax=Diplodia corticola TaxID=236234 RepID=A0A1J9RPZ9_9PEZI|nr:pyridoxal-dependent decarboxylase domain protein [Diplodia corticola]OJD29629.1 pyridoxal-dependent decarboxylase domain protein [Diplodia corticola]
MADENSTHNAISAYFIGPKAENLDNFRGNVDIILDELKRARLRYARRNEDPDFISDDAKMSAEYRQVSAKFQKAVRNTAKLLGKHSVPFWSPRYQAHMCTDMTMPSLLGYFMTMIYNPNNVALEASPISTIAEVEVGEQLCELFGYNNDSTKKHEPTGWGHITCDGTVANLESIWVARNLKFYPFSLKWAMEEGQPLAFIPEDFRVRTCQNVLKEFRKLDEWELLNLRPKTILDIPQQLQSQYKISPTFLQKALDKYNIQTCGKDALVEHFTIKKQPTIMVSSSRHYSWPKGGAIAGVGSGNIIGIQVDDSARVDLADLEKQLEDHRLDGRAVYAVVAVIGSTEEGAVDPLQKILELRQKFQAKGMSFLVHADAAWGGYFTTMLRKAKKDYKPAGLQKKKDKKTADDAEGASEQEEEESDGDYSEDSDAVSEISVVRSGRGPGTDGFVPGLSLRVETQRDLAALRFCDSVTVDPHKAGYIPYPAGALAYRDGRSRHLVTWTSPYLSRGSVTSIGIYGVEGSKPGASAVSTWLSNKCIGLHEDGYGALMREVCFTSSMFSALWAALTPDKELGFMCVPFNKLPSESGAGGSIEADKKRIRSEILNKENKDIVKDEASMKLLRSLGSDLNINAFALNWYDAKGKPNEDVEEANYLMERVVKRLSIDSPNDKPSKIPFYLTSTEFEHELYGKCAATFKRRLELDDSTQQPVMVLRNVVMSPFPTTNGFLKTVEDEFVKIVKEEVEVSRKRNSDAPDFHSFLIHGDKRIYLSYRTMFHIGSHRRQLIVSAELDDADLQVYRDCKFTTEDPLVLKTAEKIDLSSVIAGVGTSRAQFTANLTTRSHGILHPEMTVRITHVVLDRPLDSKSRDDAYPSGFMPFYLYGADGEYHLDHMLVRHDGHKGNNIALTAGTVTLDNIPAEDLSRELHAGNRAAIVTTRVPPANGGAIINSGVPSGRFRAL